MLSQRHDPQGSTLKVFEGGEVERWHELVLLLSII